MNTGNTCSVTAWLLQEKYQSNNTKKKLNPHKVKKKEGNLSLETVNTLQWSTSYCVSFSVTVFVPPFKALNMMNFFHQSFRVKCTLDHSGLTTPCGGFVRCLHLTLLEIMYIYIVVLVKDPGIEMHTANIAYYHTAKEAAEILSALLFMVLFILSKFVL